MKIAPGGKAKRGTALVIILSFVVLLTVAVVAFFSRATTERQVSNNSARLGSADTLALSALDLIIGDLKQEIVDGSAASAGSPTLYPPSGPANMLPQRSGTPAAGAIPIPNLIRISIRDNEATGANPMPSPGVPSRASSTNSTAVSINGRSVTPARWNSHYLIPRAITTVTIDSTPVTSFIPPEWVLVTRAGPAVEAGIGTGLAAVNNASPANTNFVIGRYAFAIYDEGGLLDLNVVGYPSSPDDFSLAIGDRLSTRVRDRGHTAFADIREAGLPNKPPNSATPQVDTLLGWRNYASLQPSSGSFASDYDFSSTSAIGMRFLQMLDSNPMFLSVRPLVDPATQRTDQVIPDRQTLLRIRRLMGFSQNALQNFGTFSRDLDYSTRSLNSRVSSSFTRRDGTAAVVNEPLYRRFPVSQLAWIGQNGPIAPGTAATVQRDFGLMWVPASSGPPPSPAHWAYVGPTPSNTPASAFAPNTGTREPDFFEVIGVAAGLQFSTALKVGACIIDQNDTDQTTTGIEYAPAPNTTPTPSPLPANPTAYGMEKVSPPVPSSAPTPPSGVVILDRKMRSAGQLGYAYNGSSKLNLASSSTDAPLLDYFSGTPTARRAGAVNLNTRNPDVVAALVSGATRSEPLISGGAASTLSSAAAKRIGASIVAETTRQQAIGREDIPRINVAVAAGDTGASPEQRELIARALTDSTTVRIWNLFIDVIGQAGRYPPSAIGLNDFVVEGEKRYWLHIAIDRFTGEVIDQQLEAVYE